MIARVASSNAHRDRTEEARQLWEREIIPAMKKHRGFRNVYVLGDEKSGRVLTISIWDSEEAARAWDASDDISRFKQALSKHVEHVPQPDQYTVQLHG